MELHEALSHISEIRQRMAETEVFRGYRSIPVACSGLLAIAAALAQPAFVPNPTTDFLAYCMLWTIIAALSLAGVGLTMLLRDRFGAVSQTREVTLLALSQFLPALGVGVVLTGVIVRFVPAASTLLPGLWQLLFSLGLFASCRLLPRATFVVAVFYLVSGAVTLAMSAGEYALNPWLMGVPFGLGQLFAAVILYWNLERVRDEV